MAKFDQDEWARSLTGNTIAEKYKLERILGLGGMGAVFEALHLETDRRVAAKVLLPLLVTQPVEVERFRREARSAGSVNHPGVVSVLDFGIDATSGPYLIMELLEGESLRDRLTKRGKLTTVESVAIAADALDTLQAIHAKGIVHRDLKPANLFLARVGDTERVKILDFGIARALNPTAMALTKPGTVLGTPRFMAPEQALAKDVDPRADVYTIGLILNLCISGKVPYSGLKGLEVLRAVVAYPTTALSKLCPELPRNITGVIDMACAIDPNRRFQSAEAFRRAILHAMESAQLDESRRTIPMEELAFVPPTRPRAAYVPNSSSSLPPRGLQRSDLPLRNVPESIPVTRSMVVPPNIRSRRWRYWGLGAAALLACAALIVLAVLLQ